MQHLTGSSEGFSSLREQQATITSGMTDFSAADPLGRNELHELRIHDHFASGK